MLYNLIDNGKPKWIVLLHCVCGNEKVFKNQMDLLNKHYNILVIRFAGHDIESNKNEATFDYVIQEVREFVSKQGCKIDIMGLSMGAMIATKYICQYPNDVENAYLIGNIYGFSVPLFKLGYRILMKINKILPRFIYMYVITRLILPYKSQEHQRKKLYASSRRMSKHFLYAWMNEMGTFIIKGEAYLKCVSGKGVNIRHIYGSNDKIFLNWTKKKTKNLTNFKLNIIAGAGHLCNIEQPEQVNIIIEGDNFEGFSSN